MGIRSRLGSGTRANRPTEICKEKRGESEGECKKSKRMVDSGAILFQISALKDMLDQVNVEMQETIQLTREIDSEIVKCSELESGLAVRDSELTKVVYMLEFEIIGLESVTAVSRTSVTALEKELCSLRIKHDQMLSRTKVKREEFITSCLNFQKDINMGEDNELRALLLEEGSLQSNVQHLERQNDALQNSVLAFAEEILKDLHNSNSALCAEIKSKKWKNEKLQKDIDILKTTLALFLSTVDEQW